MRINRPGAILAIAATVLIVLGSAAAAHAALTRIVAPSGTLVTGATARFVVSAPASTRSLTARLSGHDVSTRFRRVAPGRYVGLIRWAGIVSPGQHSLEVLAVPKHGAPSADARAFVFGGRSRGFGTVSGMARALFAAGSEVRIRLHSEPALFSVRLNGRGVSRSFDDVPVKGGADRVGRLAADDGL
jgi:hypothetical protein